MASFLHPVGPLPPSVYWRRRAVVLGIPLVLIIAVAYSCSGSNPKPVAQSSGLPTVGASPSTGLITPSAMPTGSAPPGNSYPTAPTGSGPGGPGGGGTGPGSTPGSGTGTEGAGTGPGGSGNGGDCELALSLALDKTATGGTTNFQSGQNPTFDVSAQNNGVGNCLLSNGITLNVTGPSSSNQAWTNAACSTKPAALAVGPGGEPNKVPETIEWPFFQSVAGCQIATQKPVPGNYIAVATANGVSSAPVSFTVA